ncbi:hypothetical protein Gohar_025288 [Gossypium harknessii]|uniref:Retrotransposon Copia-like N-terminal domain-containing protein n=1 Tax=Gossypium harknessii TaxID=34285 RepID=A0A7J9HIP0_9ROSI|nr:hypothetical protein [Gossypium harknessii]
MVECSWLFLARPLLPLLPATSTAALAIVSCFNNGVFDSHFFSTKKINILLGNSNYLLWRQQVLLTIKTHKLQHFLDGRMTPPPMLVPDNDGVLHHLIGIDSSAQIWNTLANIYGSNTMSSCREVIGEHEHVTMILNGLSPVFEYVITVITGSQVSYNVQDITTMLLDAEARLQNIMVGMPSSDNVVTHHQANSTVASMSSLAYYPASTAGHPCGRRRGRSFGSRIQCQLCGKTCHLVDRYYHWFDATYKSASYRPPP